MKLFNRAVGAAFVAGLCMATPTFAAANLIVNGDFEANGPANGTFSSFRRGASDLPGWSVTGPLNGDAVSLLNTNYREPNIGFNAFSGNTALDITGGGNTGSLSGISQSVATEIGQTYTLVFWIGNADGRRNGDNYLAASVINLAIDGILSEDIFNDNLTVDGVNWLQVTRSFTAAAATTNISFLNRTPTSGPNRDAFAGLDGVSLTAAVPEPATWALMIGGFGMAGAMMRRRRAIAA